MRKALLLSLSAALALSFALPVASYADEWRRDANGWWYEIDDDDDDFTELDDDYDDYAKNGWRMIDRKWYYFDAHGYMKTGWIDWEGKQYYCDPTGAMLVSTTTPDGIQVGADGARVG